MVCTTDRGGGKQDNKKWDQGISDGGAEGPGEKGGTGSCYHQEHKRTKLGVGDIQGHMGSPRARQTGKARLREVLHKKGTGAGEEAASIKYLGVWFETGRRWGKQLEVLRKKH